MASRLTHEEESAADALAKDLQRCEQVQLRLRSLHADLRCPQRDIIQFVQLPRVSVQDLEANQSILDVLIDFNHDKLLRSSVFMKAVFVKMDVSSGHDLSGQSTCFMQDAYCRWEADKAKLLWAYLKRQLARSQFSNNVHLFHLKQQLLFNRKQSSSSLDTLPMDAPVCYGATSEGLLNSLPAFPSMDMTDQDAVSDDEDDVVPVCAVPAVVAISDDEDDVVPISAVPACQPLGDKPQPLSLEDLLCRPPPHAPPVEEPVAAPLRDKAQPISLVDLLCSPPPLAPPLEEPVASPMLIPAGGVVEEDAYFAYPAGFGDPLPEALEIGMPRRKRSEPPACIEQLRQELEEAPSTNSKAHQKLVRQAMQKKPAAIAPASASLRKRPAAAIAKDAKDDSEDDKSIGDALFDLKRRMLQKCSEFCVDQPTAGHRARLLESLQRGRMHYQIKDLDLKRVVCQTTDMQFSGAERGKFSAELLLEMYCKGTSAGDLQRVKNGGALFGVKCGRLIA